MTKLKHKPISNGSVFVWDTQEQTNESVDLNNASKLRFLFDKKISKITFIFTKYLFRQKADAIVLNFYLLSEFD